jgi:hypothetical protein
MKNPKSTSLEKSVFPRLLKKLFEEMKTRIAESIKSGFKTCGIVPVNRQEALKKIPDAPLQVQNEAPRIVSETLLNYLQACRKGDKEFPTKGRQKKIAIPAGKSVSLIDLQPSERQEKEKVSIENPEPTAGYSNDILHSRSKKRKTHHLENDSDDSSDSEDEHMSLHNSSDSTESFSGFEINMQVNPENCKIWHRQKNMLQALCG